MKRERTPKQKGRKLEVSTVPKREAGEPGAMEGKMTRRRSQKI